MPREEFSQPQTSIDAHGNEMHIPYAQCCTVRISGYKVLLYITLHLLLPQR